jgi:hypothetical protein
MSTESEESTVIQSTLLGLAHLKAFLTPKIGLTGMATGMNQTTV